MRSTAQDPGPDRDPPDRPRRVCDEAEFEQFYHEHYLSVVKYLASMSGGPRFVEDAAQEAMAKMWVKWPLLVQGCSLKKAYLS